jgi:hypothetical protein
MRSVVEGIVVVDRWSCDGVDAWKAGRVDVIFIELNENSMNEVDTVNQA